jgi:hypothetical protein
MLEWAPISKSATADAHTRNDRIGVKKPIVRDRNINKAPTINRLAYAPDRFVAFIKKFAATEMRSRNNASPGRPWGNIENNCCTALSVAAFAHAKYPNSD